MEMSSFNWKNDFSVGIRELEDQHKDFFDILGRLGAAAGIPISASMLEVRE